MLTAAQHQNVLDHAPEVQLIVKGGKHSTAVLKNASPQLVRAITHMVRHGHSEGRIHPSYMQKHGTKIAKLVSPTTSAATKTRVVQNGSGFIGNLLGSIFPF